MDFVLEKISYSLSAEHITFTIHSFYPENNEISETFRYNITADELTIYGFSNPFSVTNEVRTDIVFARCELPTLVE
jgi:hypothetical protein